LTLDQVVEIVNAETASIAKAERVIVAGRMRVGAVLESLPHGQMKVVAERTGVAYTTLSEWRSTYHAFAGRDDFGSLDWSTIEVLRKPPELIEVAVAEGWDRSTAEQRTSPTAFLDARLDARAGLGEISVGAPELKDDHPHRTGEQYFRVELVFRAEERDKFVAALRLAKDIYEVDSIFEAAVLMAGFFVKQHAPVVA
jgi:hypothetical protein